MKYKIFASDLDSTLLYNNEVSKENILALNKLVENGIIPVFVTGRIYTSALYYATKNQLKIPIIGCNGAVVADSDQNIISYTPIDDSIARDIAKLCDEEKLYYHFYDHDTFYSKAVRLNRIKHITVSMGDDIVFQVNTFFSKNAIKRALERGHGVAKFVINISGTDMDDFTKQLDLEKLEITKSGPNSIEIMKKGVSKASGLEILTKELNYSMEEIVAIGDYENDIPMIRESGFGIAMGNALKSVKDEADYITTGNDDHGVAHAIDHILRGM